MKHIHGYKKKTQKYRKHLHQNNQKYLWVYNKNQHMYQMYLTKQSFFGCKHFYLSQNSLENIVSNLLEPETMS